MRAFRLPMDPTGEEFLPRPGLPRQEHGRVRRRETLRERDAVPERGRAADHLEVGNSGVDLEPAGRGGRDRRVLGVVGEEEEGVVADRQRVAPCERRLLHPLPVHIGPVLASEVAGAEGASGGSDLGVVAARGCFRKRDRRRRIPADRGPLPEGEGAALEGAGGRQEAGHGG